MIDKNLAYATLVCAALAVVGVFYGVGTQMKCQEQCAASRTQSPANPYVPHLPHLVHCPRCGTGFYCDRRGDVGDLPKGK